MTRIDAFTAGARVASFALAFVLFAPVALATLLQAAQIVA
jgi:hypothetical protein